MLDAITTATITSALAVLSNEVAKGVASEAAKGLWTRIVSLFSWKTPPADEDLAPTIAERLQNDPALARHLLDELRTSHSPTAARLVGRINAEKVVVAQTITVGRDFKV